MVNNSYMYMAAACALPLVPVLTRVGILTAAAGGLDKIKLENPRGEAERIKSKGKVSDATYELCTKLSASQSNGWENLPVFLGAVLAMNQAGVDKDTVEPLCQAYLAARVLHFIFYVSPGWFSGLGRTLVYMTGCMGVPLYMYSLAAQAAK
mmetsp:Transcript_13828/g.21576  ORF Transcript_13828/g.21576 Transcript_13828/m.21576 type:complete len:151 (-) Transcript_13828:249-701(-)